MTKEQPEAEELSKEFNVPIQVSDVCEILSGDGFEVTYDEENISSEGFEGISIGNDQVAGIIVNSNIESDTRKRFTAFHEIGHVVLHIFTGIKTTFRCSKKDISSDKQTYEKEANSFASSLLLPKHIVKPLVDRNDLTWSFIKEVADKCDASRQATARRLISLSKEEYSLLIQYGDDVWMPIKSPSCHHFIERNKFPSHLVKKEMINDSDFPSSWDECEASEWMTNSSQTPPVKYSAIYYPKHNLTMTMLYMPEVDEWEEDDSDDEWAPPSF